MFGNKKTSEQTSPTPKETLFPSEDLNKEKAPEEKKKPRPLANPEAMPENLMKYEKPSSQAAEKKKEKATPVLISLANPEAMPGPKKVKGEKSAREIVKEKEEKKEDLFFEIFNRISENIKPSRDESLLGKLEEEETSLEPKTEETKSFQVKKYIVTRKSKKTSPEKASSSSDNPVFGNLK